MTDAPGIETYPVGLFRDLQQRRLRYGIAYLKSRVKERNWRAVRNYFNGYLGTPRVRPRREAPSPAASTEARTRAAPTDVPRLADARRRQDDGKAGRMTNDKCVTIRVTDLRGGTRIEQERPCVDCGKTVRGDRAAMPEVLCAGCAPFRRLAEDWASITGQSREAIHQLLSALAKPAPVIDITAARARIAHMAIGGAYPACPDRKDEHDQRR